MGVFENIDIERFPKQSDRLHSRVSVCFKYDTTREIGATVVRDDLDEPGRTIFRLDDGRYVLATECQYAFVQVSK